MSFLVPFVREKWYIFDERRYDTPFEDRTIYYMQILINKENSAGCLLDSNIIFAYNSQSRQLKNHLACNSIICSLDILFWMRTDLSAIFGCDIFPLTWVKYCAWSFYCFLQLARRSLYHFFPFNLFIHLTKDTLRVRELRCLFLGTQCSTFRVCHQAIFSFHPVGWHFCPI